MNTAVPISKHSKLLRLLKPQPASYLLNRNLCTEPNPQPPPRQDNESKLPYQFNSSSKPHTKNGLLLNPCNLSSPLLLLHLLAFSSKLLAALLPLVKPSISSNTFTKTPHLETPNSSLIHSKAFSNKRVENSTRNPGYPNCIKLRKNAKFL
ncbi:hypothetical protein CRYUN_Cryun23aG0134000 [Craigia yunnanensis]